jgi:hypothetical protein
VARVNPRSTAAKGQRLRLAVDVDRAHFFAPTGEAIGLPAMGAPREHTGQTREGVSP